MCSYLLLNLNFQYVKELYQVINNVPYTMYNYPVRYQNRLRSNLRPSRDLIYFLDSRLLVVEDIGVEPMTSCVQGRRSSQLS